jgi:hypothetical protein
MHYCRTTDELAAQWRAAGIPEGYTISQLCYNPASEMLIVELRAKDGGYLPNRLGMRHRSTDKYELISNPHQDVSFESPVTTEKYPIVVFNAKRWNRNSEGRLSEADWDGLYVFDVPTRKIELCVTGSNFIMPAPYDERGWIADVLDLSDDAHFAYVRVGLGKKQAENETMSVRYDYYVAKLNLNSRT